jgi:hypothetical protein
VEQAPWARPRGHVVSRFSWERTFNQLIGEVYPAAMEHAAQRRARRLGWLGRPVPALSQAMG